MKLVLDLPPSLIKQIKNQAELEGLDPSELIEIISKRYLYDIDKDLEDDPLYFYSK